jgi:hypothetical protein
MLGDTEQIFIENARITNRKIIEILSWMGDLFHFFADVFFGRRCYFFDAVAVWTRVVWSAATGSALKTRTATVGASTAGAQAGEGQVDVGFFLNTDARRQ